MIPSKVEWLTFPSFIPRLCHHPLWQGVFWKVFSMACFSLINGIVRYWSGGAQGALETLPVNVLVFFQNLFGTLFLLPWILKIGLQDLCKDHIGLHLMRVLSAVLGIFFWYLSLQSMPIAESVALSFTGPIFTIIGAWFLLQETMDRRRWLAIILSLSGAFIISRPDIVLSNTAMLGYAVLLPLTSALSLALSKLLTRKLVLLGATPAPLATALLLFMTPVSLPLALLEWQTPSSIHWPWLLLLGVLAALSHFSFAKSYQLAEVTFLAPFGFTKFILGTIIGYFVFGEFPQEQSFWIGMLIILLSLGVLRYKIPLYSDATRFKSN